jgi:uncharacterized Zn-binding protein involved in type VI secretion
MTWLQRMTLPAIVLLALIPLGAQAGDAPPQGAPGSGCGPSTITSGSGNVVVEGKQAARAGDTTGCSSAVVEGSSNVFINGKPAAMQGSDTGCGGSIVSGSSGVFINGKPMARTGDATGCPGQ